MNNSTVKKGIVGVLGVKFIIILVVAIIVFSQRAKMKAAKLINFGQKADVPVWLGVEVLEVNSAVAGRFALPYRRGLLVRRVLNGSPAQKAGVVQGDVIRRVGNRRMVTHSQMQNKISSMTPGQDVRIVIGTGKKLKILNVRVEPRPSANIRYIAYSGYESPVRYAPYQPPVNRPYPYFTFSGEERENERE